MEELTDNAEEPDEAESKQSEVKLGKLQYKVSFVSLSFSALQNMQLTLSQLQYLFPYRNLKTKNSNCTHTIFNFTAGVRLQLEQFSSDGNPGRGTSSSRYGWNIWSLRESVPSAR